MTEKELNIELEKLQGECVNNGGIWNFSKLALDRNISLIELYQNMSGKVKITSVQNNEKEEIIKSSIDNWSTYSGPCPERNENSSNYEKLKTDFINNLFRFIAKKEVIEIMKIENFDSYRIEIFEFDNDHMNEDFIFKTDNESYILHLGFSS